jgi:hypothetical protein
MTETAARETPGSAARAIALWAEALATTEELTDRLLRPDPGDVRALVAVLERQVQEAAAWPVGDDTDASGLREPLRQVLRQMAGAAQDLGLVADARARTIHSVMGLFRRPDVPPGTLLDVRRKKS